MARKAAIWGICLGTLRMLACASTLAPAWATRHHLAFANPRMIKARHYSVRYWVFISAHASRVVLSALNREVHGTTLTCQIVCERDAKPTVGNSKGPIKARPKVLHSADKVFSPVPVIPHVHTDFARVGRGVHPDLNLGSVCVDDLNRPNLFTLVLFIDWMCSRARPGSNSGINRFVAHGNGPCWRTVATRAMQPSAAIAAMTTGQRIHPGALFTSLRPCGSSWTISPD